MSEFDPDAVERFDCQMAGRIDDGEYACMVGSPTGEYVYAWKFDALRALYQIKYQVAPSEERVQNAINLAVRFGGFAGDHHKAWVIDQMVRALSGDSYARIVADAKAGADGPDTYGWDEGIAP